MDLNMPIMNGGEAAKAIKNFYRQKQEELEDFDSQVRLPYIIALTASIITKQLVKECIEDEFDDWFSSPL
eukprot:CAMPEP_0168625464 /NCGR_PEP_ID=MMETSP0449_2-20121227/10022_1 /TAXON_ID=1082188 /ORGANISM="Strombidium rassoulzadegani, Strain ras09" /LENGTH=69 /DNA_ID=CAMNT_0008667213 /DNA_START=560 /DNA_END=765 /DNA_ORIENTATION=-